MNEVVFVSDIDFVMYPPSLLACGCISAALNSILPYTQDTKSLYNYVKALFTAAGIDAVSNLIHFFTYPYIIIGSTHRAYMSSMVAPIIFRIFCSLDLDCRKYLCMLSR